MRRTLHLAISLLAGVLGCAALPAAAAADGSMPLQLSAAADATAAGSASAPAKELVFPGLEQLTLSGRQGVGTELLRLGDFHAGTTAAFGPDRPALNANGGVGFGGAAVGAFAEYRFDTFKIIANAFQDTSPTRGNSTFAVGFGYGAKLASDVSVAVGPSATWASGRGTVEGPIGLTTLGRNGAGGLALHDVGASVSINWQFQDRWQLSGIAGARQIVGESAFSNESDQGSATQLFTGVAFGYHF